MAIGGASTQAEQAAGPFSYGISFSPSWKSYSQRPRQTSSIRVKLLRCKGIKGWRKWYRACGNNPLTAGMSRPSLLPGERSTFPPSERENSPQA